MQELPEILGIGRASLFCCRTGKRPITRKTWLKLEAAERAAGLTAQSAAAVVREGNPKQSIGLSAEQIAADAALFPNASPEELEAARSELAPLGEAFRPYRDFTSKILESHAALMDALYEEVKMHMKAAGTWPPSGKEDGLSLTQLWAKYAPK